MKNAAASRLVSAPFSEALVETTARELLAEIGGRVTCAFVFASADYRDHLPDFLELIQVHGHVPVLAGCSGSGLIGTAQEAEAAAGFSLLFLYLPNTVLHVFPFTTADVENFDSAEACLAATGLRADEVDAWITLANPVAIDIESWLKAWNAAWPGVPCLGGLGSGGRRGDQIFLFQDRKPVEAALAIGLRGGVRVQTVVSQGCRPIGEPLTITGAEGNVVTSLGSRAAYERLTETCESLPEADRELASGNLFAGLAMSEYIDDFKTGDFLVRNLIGADPHTGVIAIGALPRVGQTLQFQLRDRDSAHEELLRLLRGRQEEGVKPFASLIFSCTGRGKHLFGISHHDAGAVAEIFGALPSTGFFCNGEIGPVGEQNFVHGYTASLALLTDA